MIYLCCGSHFLWHVSVVEFKKYLKYLKLILVKALRQMIL